MIKFLLLILIFPLSIFASALTPLPLSYGALLYDANYSSGPAGPSTIDPGQWIANLTSFNTGATSQNKITRLYPYSSDIEITCSNVNDITTCSIDPGYAAGNASVSAYRAAFPSATILPIVDIALKIGNNSLLPTNTQLADNVAATLAAHICQDSKADGVFFDIEISNSFGDAGIIELYKQVSKLFAQSPCVDSNHPNGRYMGIYHTPVLADWSTAQIMFAGNNNSFLAIPIYDVKGFTAPPTPDPLSTYTSYATSLLKNAATNSQQYKVPYTIIIPAAASAGTFQETGIYVDNPPTNFQLQTDFSQTNCTQLAFVQGVRAAACNNQNPYWMGMDYWAWNQYVPAQGDNPPNVINKPNIPDSNTVGFLQVSASCQPS